MDELNNYNNKHNAITLVELIIALTMVAVLMLMMFGVIFKKTKAMMTSPSGTFYCWKDWNGILHQRIITKGPDGMETTNSSDIDECVLDIPKILTKDVNRINAYLIGGGAAGNKFKITDKMITSSKACRTEDLLACAKNDVNCFPESPKVRLLFDGSNLYPCYEGMLDYGCNVFNSDTLKSNFEEDKERILEACVVKHLEKDYKFRAYNIPLTPYKTDLKNYLYINGNEDKIKGEIFSGSPTFYYPLFVKIDPVPVFMSESVDEEGNTESIPHPVESLRVKSLFPASTNSTKQNNPEDFVNSVRVGCKVEYQVSSALGVNEFKSYDVTDFLDINHKLIIGKDDIGKPGEYKSSDSNIALNAGGSVTYLKSNIEGKPKKVSGTKVVYKLNSSILYSSADFDIFSAKGGNLQERISDMSKSANLCDDNKDSKYCGLKVQNTGFADIVGVTHLKLLEPNYAKKIQDKKTFETNYGYNDKSGNFNDGFGLFGYNGASGNCTFKYNSYAITNRSNEHIAKIVVNGINLLKNKIPSDIKEIDNINCSEPGNGMGGAIIIQWN